LVLRTECEPIKAILAGGVGDIAQFGETARNVAGPMPDARCCEWSVPNIALYVSDWRLETGD